MGDRKLDRRAYLSSVAVAGTAFLAGCAGSTGDKQTQNTSSSSTSTKRTSTDKTTTKQTSTKTSTTETTTETTTASSENVESNDVGTYKPMDEAAATFQNIDAWSADANVDLTAETSDVYQGSQSALIQGGGGTIRRDFPIPVDMREKDISIAVNVLRPRPTNVRIWLKDTTGTWLKLVQQINPAPEHPKGWIRINPSIENATGTNFKIESILLTLDGKSGKPPKYLVDDVRFHDKMAKKGKVLFTFDDASTNLYSKVFPIMEEYGFKGSLAVPSDAIGDNGRMTQSELAEMKKKGWEICSHSTDFAVVAGASPKVQKRKIEQSKSHLQQRGLGPINAFMYPGGQVDQHTMEYVSQNYKYGFLAFTTSSKGLSSSTLWNPYFVNRSNPTTPNAVASALSNVAAYNGIYTMYHHGIDNGARFPTTPSDFRKMCDHVKRFESKGRIEVVTPSDLKLPK